MQRRERATAVNVREQALAAREAAREAEDEHTRDEAIRKRETRKVVEVRVLGLVRESVLHEWFPTADWEVYAVPADESWHGMRGYRAHGGFQVTQLEGIVCTDRPSGTDPEWAGVPCFGIGPLEPNWSSVPDGGAPDRARVFYCHTRYDEGYTSWEGTQVRTLEELGDRIARWEATPEGKAAAERLKQRPTDRVAEEEAQGWERVRLRGPAKTCPERGGACQHRDTCEGSSTVSCWLRHARIASEPEGRTTGLHRDSMG